LSAHSTACSWLSPQRLGDGTLRLRDGSLRAVLECTASAARLPDVVAALGMPRHLVQLVVRSRRRTDVDGAPRLTRLRVSYATLLAELHDKACPPLERLLVVVPWDVREGGSAEMVLNARTRDIDDHLIQAGLEPVRLASSALDALVVLDQVVEGRCEVRVGDRLARTLLIGGDPRHLDGSWFDSMEADHDLSVQFGGLELDLAAMSAGLTLWADGRVDLDRATERAETILAAHGFSSERPHLQAEPALVSTLPLCLNVVASPLVPLVRERGTRPGRTSGQPESHRVLYGVDPWRRRPVELDRFDLENPNAIVVGDAKSGCSFMVELDLARARLAGWEAHVIDPRGGHVRTVAALGGTVIAPTTDDPTPFDPFAPTTGSGGLDVRVRVLGAVIELLGLGLPARLRPVVGDALAFVYAAHGYTDEPGDENPTPPRMDEVVAALQERAARATDALRPALEGLVRQLEEGQAGSAGLLALDRPSVRRAGPAPITAYSLAGLPEEHRPLAMLLSLDQIWSRVPGNRPALLVVDGIDPLLPHEMSVRFVAELAEAAAERRAGLTLVTRDVAGLLQGPLRDCALGAGMKVLLRQTPTAASLLSNHFHLTPAEQSWLVRAEVGEGLLLVQGERLAFKAIASDEEHRLITQGGAR
jgi:hypothetical protein